ncbi:TonB family protein [Pontibacter sp. MBLB2868]|uniref:TonB family protein n=1 Tax=Pontibacter sp. MBLB2868 TaxID=3451555 RepID=UPI003F752AA6
MKKNNILTRLAAATLIGVATLVIAPAALAQTSKPYSYVEQMPQFKGGEVEMMKFLAQNIHYPEDAQKAGVEGLLVISFVVDNDGSLENLKVLKGLTKSLDAEALRVVKQMEGNWKPGKQNGKEVAVQYTLPIRYSLKKDKGNTSSATDSQPQFKGGQEAMMQIINQNLKMPEEAKKENLDAKVLVRFTVEKDGSVSNIKLDHTKLKKTVGPDSELDYMDAATFNLQNKTILAKLAEAAAAAVKATSGMWEPAKKNGQAVAAELVLPVQFFSSEAESSTTTSGNPEATNQKSEVPRKLNFNEIVPLYKLDEKPRFKEGENADKRFFAKNTRYPKTEAEGDVSINFLVYEDGTIGKIGVRKSMGVELKDEVLRVLELSKDMWQPGKKDGKAVNTYQMLTFRFVNIDGQKQTEATSTSLPADVVITKYR